MKSGVDFTPLSFFENIFISIIKMKIFFIFLLTMLHMFVNIKS